MASENALRPTWAQINLDNLRINFNNSKSFIGSDINYMAVVKADAYGHGAVTCARMLENCGIDWFGVALPEEASELRNAGIKKPILCLGGFWSGQEGRILADNLTPAIFRVEQAEQLNRAALERGVTADIHVKIDTGMGRVGVRFDEAVDFADRLKRYPNLRLRGLMTHFASADRLEETDYTELQVRRFSSCTEMFREKGFKPEYFDLANSPASVAYPQARGNMVRLGGILYGLGDDVLPQQIEKPDLKPVLSLHSRIALLKRVPAGESLGYGRTFTTRRDSQIATIPIGYHDGYRRAFSNKARVIVNRRFAPVVGRVSMDWTILDVTEIADVKVGDEVILIGTSADRAISAGDLAGISDTISYEITCGISRRVPRFYLENGEWSV